MTQQLQTLNRYAELRAQAHAKGADDQVRDEDAAAEAARKLEIASDKAAKDSGTIAELRSQVGQLERDHEQHLRELDQKHKQQTAILRS